MTTLTNHTLFGKWRIKQTYCFVNGGEGSVKNKKKDEIVIYTLE